MTFSEEVLMAYADNELDESTRIAVESAMAADSEIARRIAQHRELRKRLSSAFEPVLNEQVPSRLTEAARNARASAASPYRPRVIPLPRRLALRRSAPHWAALAASLLLGIIAGRLAFRAGGPGLVATRDGQLMASGFLADALTSQLASRQQPAQRVQIGVSFRSKSGEYCRTFSIRGPALAGLACRAADGWRLQLLSRADEQPGAATGYRQAASMMPPALVSTVADEISGEPLDARAEAAARGHGWQP